MEASPSHLPDALKQQRLASGDQQFQAQLMSLATAKKPRIFISYARPIIQRERNYSHEETNFNEQGTVEFATKLVEHLTWLNFNVILADNDLGIGCHLQTAMKDEIERADHVLLLVTRTYLYKVRDVPDSGVNIELSFIKSKIQKMGGARSAGQKRFVLPFVFTHPDDLTGFPLVDGHGGFAPIYLGEVGYREALVDLANKLFKKESESVFTASEAFFSMPLSARQKIEKQEQKRLVLLKTQVAVHKSHMIKICQEKCLSWIQDNVNRIVFSRGVSCWIASLAIERKKTTAVGVLKDLFIATVPILGQLDQYERLKEIMPIAIWEKFANYNFSCYLMGIVLCHLADGSIAHEDLEKDLLEAIKEKRDLSNSASIDEMIVSCKVTYGVFLKNSVRILDKLENKDPQFTEAYRDLILASQYHDEIRAITNRIEAAQSRAHPLKEAEDSKASNGKEGPSSEQTFKRR